MRYGNPRAHLPTFISEFVHRLPMTMTRRGPASLPGSDVGQESGTACAVIAICMQSTVQKHKASKCTIMYVMTSSNCFLRGMEMHFSPEKYSKLQLFPGLITTSQEDTKARNYSIWPRIALFVSFFLSSFSLIFPSEPRDGDVTL
jgi:hypothetical protein